MRIQTEIEKASEWESLKSAQAHINDSSYEERVQAGAAFTRPPAWIKGGLVIDVFAQDAGTGVSTIINVLAGKLGEPMQQVDTFTEVVDYAGGIYLVRFVTDWVVTGDYEALQIDVAGPATVTGITIKYRADNPQ